MRFTEDRFAFGVWTVGGPVALIEIFLSPSTIGIGHELLKTAGAVCQSLGYPSTPPRSSLPDLSLCAEHTPGISRVCFSFTGARARRTLSRKYISISHSIVLVPTENTASHGHKARGNSSGLSHRRTFHPAVPLFFFFSLGLNKNSLPDKVVAIAMRQKLFELQKIRP